MSQRDGLIEALIAAGSRRSIAVGDELCREQADSTEAFVVVSGLVDALVDGHDGAVTVARHGPGALVGEVSTLLGGGRTASLVAAEAGEVVAVDRDAVRRVFDEYPAAGDAVVAAARERTDRSRVAALLSSELRAPDGAVVAAIAQQVTWTRLRAGGLLFQRDDEADAAYLVVSGRVGITDRSPLSDDTAGPSSPQGTRSERPIEVGRGGIVGEFGLLEGRRRSATVRAMRDTVLARLSADDFARLSHDHSALAMGLVRRVLERTHASESAHAVAARSFSVACTAPVEPELRRETVRELVAALGPCGTTSLLDAASVDQLLDRPGTADTAPGDHGEVRLAELLHQRESEVDHLVLDAGDGRSEPHWVARAVGQTDQLVILCSPQPDDIEAAPIAQLLRAVPLDLSKWLVVMHPAGTERPLQGRALRERFGVDEIHHVCAGSDRDLARVARLAAGRGVALVLSGGGARGNAHIGVYANLLDAGVPVDRVIGSSMGSIVAGMIGRQLSPDELLEDMRAGSGRLLDYTFPVVSLLRGRRIVGVLDGQFGDTEMDDLWVPFTCLSTNLTTAKPYIHRTGSVARAIRTSIAIPGVLPPVANDGDLLADGGILDNLPVGIAADDPSIDVIIAADVAPPAGPTARADFGLSVSGWSLVSQRVIPAPLRSAATKVRGLVRRGTSDAPTTVRAKDHPPLSTTLLRSLMIGSAHTRDTHLASGEVDLYLDLDVRGIGLLDFETVDAAAERGAEQSKGPIAAWLDERGGTPWGAPEGAD
ncbi:MAG: cyclic nucleotide-binding domain-containing protein [Ilumatobacter sp.]